MKFKLLALCLTAMLLGIGFSASAALIDAVQKDFAAVNGCVVMPTGNEYIIDLDAAQGVAAGDLMAVVEQGDAIVHPVTGKVLGTMDKTIAVLQVSRVKSGYSYATLLSGAGEAIKAGTKLERFGNLSAVYRDETNANALLFTQLKTAVPALQWQQSASAKVADLFFVNTTNGLQVRDSKGQIIRAYAPESQPVAAPPVTAAAKPGTVQYTALPAASAPSPTSSVVPGAVTYEQTSQVGSYGGSALNMEFPRFNKVGQFDKSTTMADFETVSDQLLLATTDGSTIQVFTVAQGLTQLATGDSVTMGQILALSWYQPQAGQAYLAVTVWSDKTIHSELLRLDGNQLVPVVTGYSSLLAGFDTNGDGNSELLLSQEFDRETFYGRRVYELTLDGNRFNSSVSSFSVPRSFQLFGAVFADITGDGSTEICFVRNRRLYIYRGDAQIYKSSKELDISISTVTYDVDPSAQNPMIVTAGCDVAPVAADLDGDGVDELVAIAVDANVMQAIGSASAIDKSWLAVFKYRNGMIMKGTLGDKLERPVQGVAVANDQALMVATDVAGILDGNSATYLLAVPVK
ncbi:MAG: VCBS repeat-containing protein [Desulfuromonas sp.]|nr:VCBS repeat-containing protein [Desulfuromonas sp.]